jgi:hypothetical protein
MGALKNLRKPFRQIVGRQIMTLAQRIRRGFFRLGLIGLVPASIGALAVTLIQFNNPTGPIVLTHSANSNVFDEIYPLKKNKFARYVREGGDWISDSEFPSVLPIDASESSDYYTLRNENWQDFKLLDGRSIEITTVRFVPVDYDPFATGSKKQQGKSAAIANMSAPNQALRNAHNAGDSEGASRIAGVIKSANQVVDFSSQEADAQERTNAVSKQKGALNAKIIFFETSNLSPFDVYGTFYRFGDLVFRCKRGESCSAPFPNKSNAHLSRGVDWTFSLLFAVTGVIWFASMWLVSWIIRGFMTE